MGSSITVLNTLEVILGVWRGAAATAVVEGSEKVRWVRARLRERVGVGTRMFRVWETLVSRSCTTCLYSI